MKIKCTTCSVSKETEHFHKRSASSSGYAPSCKKCRNDKEREKYHNDDNYRAQKLTRAEVYNCTEAHRTANREYYRRKNKSA